jgi:dTDP-4-dehydrorhamnose reductase
MTRILITGASGLLGHGLAAALTAHDGSNNVLREGNEFHVAGRHQAPAWAGLADWHPLDLARAGELEALLGELQPQLLIHAAAISSLQECEQQPEQCWRVNSNCLAEVGTATNTRILLISTDQVFSGDADCYYEDSKPAPLHSYGESKMAAETMVLAPEFPLEMPGLVARIPLLLGPRAFSGKVGADTSIREQLEQGQSPSLFVDEIRSPLSTRAAATGIWLLAARALASPELAGVFHFAGSRALSRLALGEEVCAFDDSSLASSLSARLHSIRLAEYKGIPRPPCLVLSCARALNELGWEAPNLQQCLAHTLDSAR